ncbi:hypothetical protein POPTR_010G080600v4 [Populus trichocarpa]|uniref:Uncharacterized protein n=1 Tax=Populus trichocarpa TaxID=3694 RepID=A0ACC0SCB1_POPTR|nr:uncharacterized protein LOC7474168 isoform X1 [Populus trichocarpa]KAI5573286.1 hypothetical protein BDE02_10G070300 [Populus trichocarpa]KAI9386793.1 hypothetical protein POPTR_010G080600v4 [Populus trichocarpa]
MPFPMKIQPIDIDSQARVRAEPAKPVLKSRLKRLFDRQLPNVLRISSVDKAPGSEAPCGNNSKDDQFEPSSVCLAKMVQSYMEESNDKPFRGRHRCNCFNGTGNDSSDDEFDVFGNGFGESMGTAPSGDACDFLKSLIPCASVAERNLLADTAMILEKNKNHKQKDGFLRKIVTDGLASLGYNSSICKSKWDKSPSFPAGTCEYEYVDVIVEGERLLIDIDFKSEFEIARSTGAYKAILQSLPYIFVGKSERLGQIVSIVSEAAKQSLKKKGMHFPPWRKAEYMRAKWLSPCTRLHENVSNNNSNETEELKEEFPESDDCCGEFELIFGENSTLNSESSISSPEKSSGEDEKVKVRTVAWQPPAVKSKGVERGARMVTGLASLLKEKP